MKSSLLGPVLALFLVDLCLCADPPAWPPVVRSTDDRDHDLIEALIESGRFDDALGICQRRQQQVVSTSDAAARWAIRASQVLTRQWIDGPAHDVDGVTRAEKPVRDLLESYPDHRRALFLEAQRIDVHQQAALQEVAHASLASEESPKLAATKTLVRVTDELESLIRDIADRQSASHRQPPASDDLRTDLDQLRRSISVNLLSLELAQTELFPPDSDDRIAAATRAERAADQALARISVDSPAGLEIQRLKIAAILRAGQSARAAQQCDAIYHRAGRTLSDRDRAMWISVLIANDDPNLAGSLLDEFFGDDPLVARRSMEMDLVRLEYLLQFRPHEAAGWFDAMEQRGGAYARRRAERVALQRMRPAETTTTVDGTLLAAAGRDWLRRGDPIRAADLLAAAATGTTNGTADGPQSQAPSSNDADGNERGGDERGGDERGGDDPGPSRPLQYATEAAAAYVKGGKPTRAAELLIAQAERHPRANEAPAVHLQAIYLLRNTDAQRVEALLRTQLDRWPTGPTTDSARRWLAKLLHDQGRLLEAAEIESGVDSVALTAARLDAIANAWRLAFHESDDAGLTIASQRFQSSMKPLLDHPLVAQRYLSLASTLLNRDFLAGLPADRSADPFAAALIAFRQTGTITPPLRSIPSDRRADVRWRLIRDGRSLPQLRSSIADLLEPTGRDSEPTFEQAELSQWSGEWADSIRTLQALVATSPDDAEIVKRAATLLGLADHAESQQMAIAYWDQVAAGTEKGTPMWHGAKLAAIELLRAMGDHQTASQRAQYILLTMPTMDERYRAKYQAVVR